MAEKSALVVSSRTGSGGAWIASFRTGGTERRVCHVSRGERSWDIGLMFTGPIDTAFAALHSGFRMLATCCDQRVEERSI
jgi:hypothetical protein